MYGEGITRMEGDMQGIVITTKYLGPTDNRGSRIKALTNGDTTVTIGYDHSLSGLDVHEKAARALAAKLGHASANLIGGWTKDGAAFVIIPE